MAIDKFNSVDGFSVAIPPITVVDGNANIIANALTANGTVNFGGVANGSTYTNASPNVSLGLVSNLHILGGNSGQALLTDGTGNLRWGNTSNPADANTAVQYNLNGSFGGNAAAFSYTDSTTTLRISSAPWTGVTTVSGTQFTGLTWGTPGAGSITTPQWVSIDNSTANATGNARIAYANATTTGAGTWSYADAGLGPNVRLTAVAQGAGSFLVVGQNVAARSNQLTPPWDTGITTTFSGNILGVAYGAVPVQAWVIVGEDGVRRSTNNGLSFSAVTGAPSSNVYSVSFNANAFVAGSVDGIIALSDAANSEQWTSTSIEGLTGTTFTSIAYSATNGYIVAFTNTGAVAVIRDDFSAEQWRQISPVDFVSATVVGTGTDEKFVALDSQGTSYTALATEPTRWVRLATGLTQASGIASSNTGTQLAVDPSGNISFRAAHNIGQAIADAVTAVELAVSGQVTLPAPEYITIPGGAITQPDLTATLDANGSITSVTVVNGGSGYDVAPSLSVNGSNTLEATLSASVSNGQITAVAVLEGGAGYSTPTITADALTKFLRTDGDGHLSWSTVTGTGGTGQPSGPNYSLQFNNVGTLGGSSFLTFDPNGNAAANIPDNLFTVSANTLVNSPNVTFSNVANIHIPGGNARTAVLGAATFDANGTILSVAVANSGQGYDYAPLVTVTGSNSRAANLQAVLTGNAVTAISVIDGGVGYAPTAVVGIAAPRPKFLRTDGNANLSWSETDPSTGSANVTPAGINTSIQYNDGGALGGSPLFTYDRVTNTFAAGSDVNFGGVFDANANAYANASPNVTLGEVANLHIRGGNANAATLGLVTVFGNGAINTIAIGAPGDGYTQPPRIIITGANTNPATILGTLDANGGVNGFTFISRGLGYSAANVTATAASPTPRYLQTDGNGNLSFTEVASGTGSAEAAGANGEVQFNTNDLFDSSSSFTFNANTTTLTVGNAAGAASVRLIGNTAANSGIVLSANNGSAVYQVTIKPNRSNTASNWTLTLPNTAGTTGTSLITDGNGVTRWSAAEFIASGSNSNVQTFLTDVANGLYGNVVISANNQANIITISSNGTHATTTIEDDVNITGNLSVTGNIIYTDVEGLNVLAPIIDIGTGANNTPLRNPDAFDRGQAYHFYNPNLVQGLVANLIDSSNAITVQAGFDFNDLNIGAHISVTTGANNQPVFPDGTVVTNGFESNNVITVSELSLIAANIGDPISIGNDLIRFSGFDQSNDEYVFASNVEINNYVVSIPSNNYSNVRAANFIGNLANGNTSVSIEANANINLTVTGKASVLNISNTAADFGDDITVSLASNLGPQSQRVTLATSTDANAFTQSWTLTLPANSGYAYPAVVSSVTLGAGNTVTGVVFSNAGAGYDIAPTITILGANTLAAIVEAVLDSNGSVSGVTIVNTGANYNAGATATITAPTPKYLQTDGAGVTRWREVPDTGNAAANGFSLANGNSNIFVYQSNNITFSAAGNANVVSIGGNSVTVTRDLTTANVNLAGNSLVIGNPGGNTVFRGNANLSLANVELGNVDSLSIVPGNVNQYLQTAADPAGNVRWANGTIQYIGAQNDYQNTETSLSGPSGSSYLPGATTLALDRELWSYTDSNTVTVGTANAGTDLVTVAGDATAVLTLGSWVKFSPTQYVYGPTHQILDSVYDVANNVTTLDLGTHELITASIPAWVQSTEPQWDYGNLANTLPNIQIGVTQIVIEGDPEPNTGTPTYTFTIQNVQRQPNNIAFGSVIDIWPPLSNPNGYPLGQYLFQFTTGVSYIDTVALGNSIAGTVSDDRILTLEANTNAISRIANGSSNVSIAANGAVTISSNTISNIVTVTGNADANANILITAVDIAANTSITGNLSVSANGNFTNLLVYDTTKTQNFALAGSITGASVTNAGQYVFDGPERPVVTISGGDGADAQVSVAWSNAAFGGNIYTISGVSLDNSGGGYTTLPNISISGNSTNITVTTPAVLTLSSNIGNISNVRINGGSNGQSIITDGNGNLSFGYTATDWILDFGTGTPNLITSYTANGAYSSGASSVVVRSIGYANANVAQTFPVGSYITFTNGASWNEIANITVLSNIEAQLSLFSPLTSNVANGQIVRGGNTVQPLVFSTQNNIKANFVPNTSGVATFTVFPAGTTSNASNGVQYNFNNVFQASNSFTFVPNSNVNAGGQLTVPNITVRGNFVHTAVGNSDTAQFLYSTRFLTSNYANGASSSVYFGNVQRIYIPGGNANAAAVGTVTLDGNGSIVSVALSDTGDGYTVPPLITVSGPNTSRARLTTMLDTNGAVSNINVDRAGAGYSTGTIVVSIAAPTERFLSTDGAGNLSWQEANTAYEPTVPGGSNTQVQFNDNGDFNGVANFTYDRTTNVMFVGNTIQVGTDNAAANSNALSTITLGNNQIVVANLANLAINTTITSNTINGVFANFSNRANFFGNVVIGSDLVNSNTTINGIGVIVGNANSNTIIGNARITANNISVTNLTVNANTGTANLGRVGNIKISGGSNLQLLQTDGNGNLQWANGWFQYQTNIAFDTTLFYVANTTLVGNSNIWVIGDVYDYRALGDTLLANVTGSPTNVTIAGNRVALYQTGDRIKLTANVGLGIYLDAVQYDGANAYTVLSNTANAWPDATAGDEIFKAFATNSALSGQTVSFTGVGENDLYTVNQPIDYDAVNTASLLRLTSSLANAVPVGANVFEATIAPNYTTEFLKIGNGLAANIDISGRTLTVNATIASTIANGNSNISIVENGNIMFASNGVSNIVSISGNLANGLRNEITVNARVDISNTLGVGNLLIQAANNPAITSIGNLDVSLIADPNAAPNVVTSVNINGGLLVNNTAVFTGNIQARGNLVDLGTVANLKILGGANTQVLTVANANANNYQLTWTTPITDRIFTTNANSNLSSSVSVDANAGAVRIGVAGRENAIVVDGTETFTETTISDDVTITGNLNVQGNTNYVNVNSLSVADPIINLGVSANGSPLVINDGKDRGILNHFYGANLITTISGNYLAGNTTFTLANVTNAAANLAVFALNANSELVFSANAVVSNVDPANSQITVSEASLVDVENGAQIVVGSDHLNFMGWSTANTEFVFANDVSVNNFVVGFVANDLANIRAANFRGNLEVGNANIIGDGNSWIFNAANTQYFLEANNNTVSITANTVNVSGNGYAANFQGLINVRSNTNVAISAGNVMTFAGPNIRFPTVANIHILGGNANAATTGTITLDVDGRITNVSIATNGDGYTSPPTVTVSGPNTLPAILAATISATGIVTGIGILDSGLGYAANSVVVNIAPPATKFLATDGNGNLSWSEVQSTSGAGNGTPGGNNTQIQFNNNGLFGGSNSFTFTRSTSTVTVVNLVNSNRAQFQGNVMMTGPNVSLGQVSNLKISGGSSNTYLKTDGSGNLSWDAGTDLQPFLRFIAPLTANNQQFTSNAIANLGNSEFYNVMKDGVYLEPIIDWTLVDANTIQVNRFLRQDSVIDILATATDGTLGTGDQPPSFIRAYQQQSQTLSSPDENLIFDSVTVNSGTSIALNNLSGVFTLQPNIIYKLAAEVPTFEVTGTQTQVALQWWDITNDQPIGSAAFYYQESSGSDYFTASGSITAVLSPLVETQVALRAVEGVDAIRELITNQNPEFITNSKYPWAEIQDVSSTGEARVNPLGASGALQYNNAGNLAGTDGVNYDPTGLTRLTVLGNLDLSVSPNVTLGNLANISITGGANGEGIVSDGAGGLYWGSTVADRIVSGSSNVVAAANGNITMSVSNRANVVTVASNGVTLSTDSSITLSGNTGLSVANTTIRATQDSEAVDWTLTLPPDPGLPGYALVTDGTGVATWQDTGGASGVIGDVWVWTRNYSIVRVNVIQGGDLGILRVGGRDGNSINVPLA